MTTPRERLITAHDSAALYYRDELLADGADGPRGYLRRRGFPELIDSTVWITGYAPPGWTALTGHLRSEGFTDQELLDAGLALTTRRGTIIDRFRDRIMFGIRELDGTLVGFTGRAAPSAGADCPKYLNSPATQIFIKSRLLFGLAEHSDALAAGATPVLTEGPLDALAIPEGKSAGIATLGTSLTREQVTELAAHSSRARVITAFDSDDAGTQARTKAYVLLAPEFHAVETTPTTRGQDLADLRQTHGLGAVVTFLGRSQPVVTAVIDDLIQRIAGGADSAEARVAALRAAAPLVALKTERVADHARQLATGLDLDHDTVTRELAHAVTTIDNRSRGRIPEKSVRLTL